ncbi:unnamed protein product, partial [Prorocentrum cordatum]
ADLRVFMFMPLLVPPLTPVSRLPSLFGAGLSAAAPRECIRRDGRPPLRRDPRAGAERRAVRVGGTRGGVWRERREGEKRKGKARWKRNWPPQPRARLGQWLLDRAPWRTAAGGNLPGEEEEGEKEEEEAWPRSAEPGLGGTSAPLLPTAGSDETVSFGSAGG